MFAEDTFDDGFDVARAALRWWHESGLAAEWGPTSSLTGGGAIALLERELGRRLGGLALVLPSGTSAIRTALRVLAGVQGERVWLSPPSWPGTTAIVASAGMWVVHDPAAARIHLIRPCDLAGDVRIPLVVDAADVPPSGYGALAASTTWHAVALSFGPGKPVDAGEGGVLVLRDSVAHRRALALTQHPVRQRLAAVPPAVGPSITPMERMNPMAAVVAAFRLLGTADVDR